MPPNPHNDTTAGRVFNALRNLARRQGRSTDELLVLYVLERFLFRVSRSPYADRLVLKGGLLLAAYDARRATRDVDLLATHLAADEQRVVAWVGEIAAIDIDNGVVFHVERAHATSIRTADQYAGVRVVSPAGIGRARVNLALDVNFGDPVTPAAVSTPYPQLLAADAFTLWGYPIDTVLAEKITTMLALGDLNTRERDWADTWRLTSIHDLDGAGLRTALLTTSGHRGVALRPLSQTVLRLPQLRQQPYSAWRRRQPADAARYPDDFAAVVQAVIAFADPLVDGTADGRRWRSGIRQWR